MTATPVSTHQFHGAPQITVADLLATIAADFDPALFVPERMDAVCDMASRLTAASPLLFEIRLGGSPTSGGRDCDALIDLSMPWPDRGLVGSDDHECWRRARTLRRACSQGGAFAGILGAQVFWCEFDYDQTRAATPIPGIFVDIVRATRSRGPAGLDIACRALALLHGCPLPRALARRLQYLWNACPATVTPTHLGALLSRIPLGVAPPSVRINLDGWRGVEPSQWLRSMGLVHASRTMEAIVAHMPDLFERISITLDVGADIGQRVGVECYPGRRDGSANKWFATFLDGLVALSLVQPHKCRAALGWLAFPPRFFDLFGELYQCVRTMSHIKLVLDPARGCLVKAYPLAHFTHRTDSPRLHS